MRGKTKYEIAPEYGELQSWIRALPMDFSTSGETIFKSRNEVKVFTVGAFQLNVKEFKIPNLFNRFVYVYFRGSKAERSFRYARKFLTLGIATPAAIGYVDCIKWGLLCKSYYVSVHYKNEFTLREVLNYQVADHDTILRQWVRFTYENLHLNNIFHLDYSPGNTLICRKDNEYEFQIVDLNRMRFGPVDFNLGLCNFRQLDTDRQTLELLAAEYASLCHKDAGRAMKLLIDSDRKNKESRHRHGKIKKMIHSIFRSGHVV
jgi:hypothetical protein